MHALIQFYRSQDQLATKRPEKLVVNTKVILSTLISKTKPG